MPCPLDIRLDREEGRRAAGAAEQGSAAIRRRCIWRTEAAIGTVIRSALARAGVDAAQATRLCLADEAAAALVALPDTPELQRADSDNSAPAGTQKKYYRARDQKPKPRRPCHGQHQRIAKACERDKQQRTRPIPL